MPLADLQQIIEDEISIYNEKTNGDNGIVKKIKNGVAIFDLIVIIIVLVIPYHLGLL